MGIVVCDNATGDPVDMDLGKAAADLTLGIVAVNAESARMLRAYATRPPRGESYLLHTGDCPFTMDTLTSQVRPAGRARSSEHCCRAPDRRRAAAAARSWYGASA